MSKNIILSVWAEQLFVFNFTNKVTFTNQVTEHFLHIADVLKRGWRFKSKLRWCHRPPCRAEPVSGCASLCSRRSGSGPFPELGWTSWTDTGRRWSPAGHPDTHTHTHTHTHTPLVCVLLLNKQRADDGERKKRDELCVERTPEKSLGLCSAASQWCCCRHLYFYPLLPWRHTLHKKKMNNSLNWSNLKLKSSELLS